VEFVELSIRDAAALSCQLVRDVWEHKTDGTQPVPRPLAADDKCISAVHRFLVQTARVHYCSVSSHLSSCLHVVRQIPTRVTCTEQDVDKVCENIAAEFGIGVPVREFDGISFSAATEGVIQKFFVMFNVTVLDESKTSDTILPENPALRLHDLPLDALRDKAGLVSHMSRHGLEQTILLARGSAKVDKSIEQYAMLVKGTNLVDFIVEITHMVKNHSATTEKILEDFFRSRGEEHKKYTCSAIPHHKLHSMFALHLLAIRRARAQILGYKSACCALENSMLERLLLIRRVSTTVTVFVKDNQAFEPLHHNDACANSHSIFTFSVDSQTGVMSVFNGRRSVVFPDSLSQLDVIDATLIKVCQISCAEQKLHPLARLHVMHDVWCAQAIFEEARFALLRSMHELLMRCSSSAAVEQAARHMNAVLSVRSHWDMDCHEQSYASLSVLLQARAMIARSEIIDRLLVAQVVIERAVCSELASVLGAQFDLEPEAYVQRMCGLRLSGGAESSRSCTLSPGNMSFGDIGSGNTACRVFQLFSIIDDAVSCVCDLRHITSSAMEFAVAMEASFFALDAIRRVHFAHNLQQLPTIQFASASICNVTLLELCDNPALILFVCKSSGPVGSDVFSHSMGLAFESLRLRETLLDTRYRSSVLRQVLKNILESGGVAEALKAEKSGFSTKPRKERELPAPKAPMMDLAAASDCPLALSLNPLCSKLVGVSFEALEGLRSLASASGDNRCMETLRVAISCELSEGYVLEALATHSQLAIDVAWRNIACRGDLSKTKHSSSLAEASEGKLPCNWAGGGLRGALPMDAAITTATALYSRERMMFNAMATMSFDTPMTHEQSVSVLHSFCSVFAAEAELPLLLAQCALQTHRLAMKLVRLPPKCSPIIAPFVEHRSSKSTPPVASAQSQDARRAFSPQGDLVDIFVLPSIVQWLKPACNSAATLNHYLCTLMALSDLLSLVHVRGVVVSENSVGDAMVGFFHKIEIELSDRMTKSTSAELAYLLQLRCCSWFVKHTLLLKAARTVMLQQEDYKNARRLLTASFLIENGRASIAEDDTAGGDGGSQAVVEHMHSRASLGFLDEEFLLTPFAERSMLGNEYSKIDFATNVHLTTLIKSVNAVEMVHLELDHLRMQLSAIDVRDGLVSLKSGRPRPENKQQLQESTEIIESYVRQQLGVPVSNLGPEDFVVKLVSRTNVLLLRKYLLEIGAIYDKVSQFEAEIQALSKRHSLDGEDGNQLQSACADLLACFSRCEDVCEGKPSTKTVTTSHLNSVLGNFAHQLHKQSMPPGDSRVFSEISECRENIEKLLLEQRSQNITLRVTGEHFSRHYVCRMLDKACAFLYKEYAYAKQLHRLRQVIDAKTHSAEVSVQSIFNPVVQELDIQNRTRRAGLHKDCKDSMLAYSKTIAACFREASVVASNCHMPGQRLARKPPTPFPDHAATQASSQVVYYSERLHPLEYPNLAKLLVVENERMEDELVCTRAFFWWKRLVATSHSVETIHRELEEKDKITKDRFGIGCMHYILLRCVCLLSAGVTHRVLATPKLIEETRMLREASELQLRILKGKCDQSMAERDELVAFKVSTQKRIEELEERRGMYELKFSPELDVDAISQRLEALPPLDGMQVGLSSPKTSRFGDKRNLQTALREVCARALCSIANLNATRVFLAYSLTA
jgi:hypothetical protein